MQLRVCAAEVAPVRGEPDEGAEQVTQALAGEPLAVEPAQDGWARGFAPRTATRAGSVRTRSVASLTASGRAGLRAGDPVRAEARAYLGAPYEWEG